MIRTLISTGRKDISKHVTVAPYFDAGTLKVKVSFKPSLTAEKRYDKTYVDCEVFVRCADRYKAQTIKVGKLSKLLERTCECVFEDFSQEHDPKIQIRIVDLETKQIHADTRPHDLPGSGKDKGKRSLIIVRECDIPKNELYKVEWRETARPILFLNNRVQGNIKSYLLRDAAFWPLIKPAVLRSVLSIIFNENLHLDKGSPRHANAEKWLLLCKVKRWNLEQPPTGGADTLLPITNWINESVNNYASWLKLPGKWTPDKQ